MGVNHMRLLSNLSKDLKFLLLTAMLMGLNSSGFSAANPEESEHNILVLGATRVGKSAFFATMINPFDATLHEKETLRSIFSYTAEIKEASLQMADSFGKKHRFNFIDTPGFSEIKPSGETRRTNHEIREAIISSLETLNKNIHHIVVLVFVPGDINPAHWEAFEQAKQIRDFLVEKDLFQSESDEKDLKIVVTRAEEYDSKRKENVKWQLESIASGSVSGLEIKGRDIYFSGINFNYHYQRGFENSMMDMMKKVYEMRNILLEVFANTKFPSLAIELKRSQFQEGFSTYKEYSKFLEGFGEIKKAKEEQRSSKRALIPVPFF